MISKDYLTYPEIEEFNVTARSITKPVLPLSSTLPAIGAINITALPFGGFMICTWTPNATSPVMLAAVRTPTELGMWIAHNIAEADQPTPPADDKPVKLTSKIVDPMPSARLRQGQFSGGISQQSNVVLTNNIAQSNVHSALGQQMQAMYNYKANNMPQGMNISADGTLSGTPSAEPQNGVDHRTRQTLFDKVFGAFQSSD